MKGKAIPLLSFINTLLTVFVQVWSTDHELIHSSALCMLGPVHCVCLYMSDCYLPTVQHFDSDLEYNTDHQYVARHVIVGLSAPT